MSNAFDTLRVVGTFLVLMYHAALSYLTTPMRLTLWCAYDSRSHVSMDLFAYWVNGFAMPLFFLAAGVSAPAAIESRGVRVFLKHRVGRLLRPLLFGSLTLIPLCYVTSAYGLLKTGRCTPDDILSWRFNPEVQRHLYGIGHLWFLEYLFIVCVLWAGCWMLGRAFARFGGSSAQRHGIDRLEQIFGSPWRPLFLAVPTALIFLVDTDTVLRIENSLVPNPSRLIHYLCFFAAGGWIARLREPKQRLIPHSRLYLILAELDFVVMAPLLLRLASAPLVGWDRILFVGLASVFPWLMILGGLGTCLRYLESKGSTMRYFAEASFWVYLIHLPIVLIVQALLLPISWPGPIKFLIVSAITAGLSLLSYEYVTRYSLIGEIVNGARKRLRGQRLYGREYGWVAVVGLFVLAFGGSAWYLRVFFWQDNFHAVIPGQIYRSARFSADKFEQVVRHHALRSVITFSGNGDRHRWIEAQKNTCRERGITYSVVSLRDDRLPPREQVQQLMALLEQCPKPILLQGYRGLDHCGFSAALALMVEGKSSTEALRQFGPKYAQFGGPRHSVLGITLLDYEGWLKANHFEHSRARLKTWADQEYLAHSAPVLPAGFRTAARVTANANRTSLKQ